MALQVLPLRDASLAFDPAWLSPAVADALFAHLHTAIAWERHRIRLFGRELEAPRLSCWIGDPGAHYTYSRTRFEPRSWPSVLLPLRQKLEHELGLSFNSVLANLYRDGRDCMGWHSDDEPELGTEPALASLSMGAARRFVMRHRQETGLRYALELPHGSLLVMRGATQAHWQHALPRSAKQTGPRINLTFRRIWT